MSTCTSKLPLPASAHQPSNFNEPPHVPISSGGPADIVSDEKKTGDCGPVKRQARKRCREDAVLPSQTLQGERFPQPYTEEEMKENTVRYVPPRTKTSNNWATPDDSGYIENPDSSFKEEDLALFNDVVM